MKRGKYISYEQFVQAGNRCFSTVLAAALAGSLVLVACNDDSAEPTTPVTPTHTDNPVNAPTGPFDTEPPVNWPNSTVVADPPFQSPVDSPVDPPGEIHDEDPVVQPPVMAKEQLPQDVDGDDLPGMIVTGLDGLKTEDIVSPWLVDSGLFRQASRADRLGDAYVSLVQYRDDFKISGYINFYVSDIDSCYVNDLDAPSGSGSNHDDPPPPRISGGKAITINAPSGPWYSVNGEPVNGEVAYEADDELPGALPVSATLSIPGEDFPTVSAYPLYEPDPVVRLLPDAEVPITRASTYSWIPGSARTYVKLDFLAYDDVGDFLGFLAGCRVNDDGVFQAPEEVLNAIDDSTYDIELRYAGGYQRFDYLNGILFHQDNQVAE